MDEDGKISGYGIDSIELFQIEFYRIYTIYRICGRLFLVISIFKITKNSILQNL